MTKAFRNAGLAAISLILLMATLWVADHIGYALLGDFGSVVAVMSTLIGVAAGLLTLGFERKWYV